MRGVDYRAFGLTISSDIVLPELLPMSFENEGQGRDVIITRADLTEQWARLFQEDEFFIIKENFCMFKVDGVAIYAIHGGTNITVSPCDGAQEDQVRLFILGTSMGILLMQRKTLPLHGSAIAVDGAAIAIVGSSGAGKSTLASEFLQRGYHLISDDLIPVTFQKSGIPYIKPAYPQQKLWLESLHHFGMEETKYRPLIDRASKFAIPVLNQFVSEWLPLIGVYELVKSDKQDIQVKPIHNLERLQTLYKHTFRKSLLKKSGLLEWHFHTIAKMVNKLDIYQLQRPTSYFTAEQLADVIESEWIARRNTNDQAAKAYHPSIS
ncbi:aldolase [Virgibacillus sp. Bac332]|uniref:aldolase n=1 Tax=Virgibacillus sp. Bac332 TaxID=2419842 RepID=UPI000EF52F83|nr:aldolase [Virgibacillus sp. Bac332]